MYNKDTIPQPASLLCVYAQADTSWYEKLERHLSPLKQQHVLNISSLWDMPPGIDRKQAIQTRIEEVSLFVLLLSADYMHTQLCQDVQQQILARQGVLVIPVLLRPVMLEGSRLKDLTILPQNNLAIALWENEDEALNGIVEEIYRLVNSQKAAEIPSVNRTPIGVTIPPDSSTYNTSANTMQGVVNGPYANVTMYFGANQVHEVPQVVNTLPIEEFVRRYREKVCGDKEISLVPILGMNDSLPVSDIYVKVHLHRQPRVNIESSEDEKANRDPMAIAQQRQLRVERRMETASDPELAVRRHKHCVIVGDPGAGKTTLLRRLALLSAEQKVPGLPDVPIYIKLHGLAGQEKIDLFHVAVENVCGYGFPKEQIESLLIQLMEQGKVLLLLDALDETVVGNEREKAEQSYQEVVTAIQQVMRRFQAMRIVVTSRKADYFRRRQLVGFTELEVLDFVPKEIEQFARKWFQYSGTEHPQQRAEAFIQDVRSRPRVATLAANPLLLTLIIMTYVRDLHSLSDNRAQLYKKCVEMLLQDWDRDQRRNRLRPSIMRLQDQELLLPEIAWHFHERGLRYFPEKDLLLVIEEFLTKLGLPVDNVADALIEISSANGLLREQAPGYYGFLHLTIQEYYAAEYCKSNMDILLSHLGDSWWEEVILLSAGNMRDAGPLLQHLIIPGGDNEIPEDIFYSKLILAGRYLAARPPISTEYQYLRQEIQDKLFKIALNCPYQVILKPLTEALAEIGATYDRSGVNGRLMGLLKDQEISNVLKGYILAALGTYGSRRLAPELLAMYQNQQFDWVYDVCAHVDELSGDLLEMVLGNMCDESEIVKLFGYLNNKDMRNYGNVDVVALIARIGGDVVIPRLIRLLEDPEIDMQVRCLIPRTLGLYGDKSVVLPILKKWLLDPNLSNYCADGLLLVNDTSIGQELVTVLSNSAIPAETRRYIARLLARLDDDSVVPALSGLFQTAPLEEIVKSAIAETLVFIGDESVRSQIWSLVANGQVSAQVAKACIYAFSYVDDKSYLLQLEQLQHSSHYHTSLRQEILIALGMLGDPLAVAELIQYSKSMRSQGRNTPYEMLALDWEDDLSELPRIIKSIISHGSVSQIAGILNDTQYSSLIRAQLLYAIPELTVAQQRDIIPQLVPMVLNKAIIERVRRAAVWALGQMAIGKNVVEQLISCIPGSDIEDELYQALWHISRRAGVRVVPEGAGGIRWRVQRW